MAGITQMLIRQLTDSSILKRFNTTERSLLQNTEGKKIYDCTDSELKQMLAYCCLMVGIERPPGDDKKMVLISFLRKYHGALTNKQVGQAFELVAAGELGTSVQEHYNNISPMYLSNVVRAYLQKLNGVKHRYELKKRIEAVPKSDPEAYYKRLVKVTEEYNVIPAFWAWDEVYDHLCQVVPDMKVQASTGEKKEIVIKYFRDKYPKAVIQVLSK
ncbi:MAG TPA: hypothetical protein VK890_11815 [Bacteroidia bacterium]|jgi:hypothetical protein|nr:hypothetical protein [Bacteroidia bacterium]